MAAPVIRVSPMDSMFDYPHLRISVRGLRGGQTITLVCVLKPVYENGETFISHGYYKADMAGDIDCSKDASLGGSYKGIDPVGLLWSLTAASNKKGAAFMPNDVTVPVEYHFFVVDGHTKPSARAESHFLCRASCRRHLLHPDVVRREVEVGRIRGTLFVPKKATATSQCFAMIDMYGTRGGINEHRAALMASHGYVSLALAYFRYKDLPKTLTSDLELEYFLEVIDWLLRQPYVKKDGIAIVGSSLGADLGMLLSTVSSKVKAVVSINGYHMLNEMWPFKYRNVLLPFRKGMFSEEFLVDGDVDMGAFRRSLSDEPDCIYPIEKSGAHFLFVCGEPDRNMDAVHTGAILMERLRDHGKEKQGELVVLRGAGHLLEPPYLPLVYLGFSKSYGMYVIFGGEMTAHAKAQVAVWAKMFDFLHQRLGPPLPMRVLGASPSVNSRL